eukprot:GEMP01085100.1.p1 GENE.GEMP01085100.1~~GEMP01085100.1.p1  ORF type:complete len:103 (+),score=17.12 GEMP01085100.1:58-366(+)
MFYQMSRSAAKGPLFTSIRKKLADALKPTHVEIVDESHKHRGHAGVKDVQQPETHFRVEVCSAVFEGVSRVERQRKVYTLLEDEFAQGLHALTLKCTTPEGK